jgi:hypothetical protein
MENFEQLPDLPKKEKTIPETSVKLPETPDFFSYVVQKVSQQLNLPIKRVMDNIPKGYMMF